MVELAERSPMDLAILRMKLLADLPRIKREQQEVLKKIEKGKTTFQLPSGDEVPAVNYLRALDMLSRAPLSKPALAPLARRYNGKYS